MTALAYAATAVQLTPDREQNQVAVRAEEVALASMIDEENGLRGYLLTHDTRFLEPYVNGRAALASANATLTSYIGEASGMPESAAALFGTRLAEESWHERWAEAAHDRAEPTPLFMMEGKVLFDAYRTEEAKFAAVLHRRGDVVSRREQRMIAARVVLELLVFSAILFLAMRQHRALRDSIVAPVAALLQHIGRVRDGELEASVDPAGPRELRGLGEGLNDMVRALAVARQAAASRDEIVRAHSVQLRQILDASREFSESLNLKYVVSAVRTSTAAVGGYERVIVWLMDDAQKGLIDSDQRGTEQSPSSAVETAHGLAGRAVKTGRITFEGAAGQVRFSDDNLDEIRAIAIPLIVGARAVGVLEARYAEARVATNNTLEIIEMLATHAATAIESARLHEITEERSQMDALTRLFNRRRLDEDLEAECKRSARYGRPLAFVMLDVDHFKAFNDAYGHPRADTALQEVAEVIGGCVRATDTAYRYGGEEFCVLLRETSGEDAMHFAERMRMRIEHRFTTSQIAGFTASFGVTEFCPATPMPHVLIEAADAAMYEAKRAGRNQVVCSPKAPVPPLLSPVADERSLLNLTS